MTDEDPIQAVIRVYGRGIKEAVLASNSEPSGWHSICALARILGMLVKANAREGEEKTTLDGAAGQMFYGFHLLKLEDVIPQGPSEIQMLHEAARLSDDKLRNAEQVIEIQKQLSAGLIREFDRKLQDRQTTVDEQQALLDEVRWRNSQLFGVLSDVARGVPVPFETITAVLDGEPYQGVQQDNELPNSAPPHPGDS